MVVAAAIGNDSNDGGEQWWRCVDSGSGGDGGSGRLNKAPCSILTMTVPG